MPRRRGWRLADWLSLLGAVLFTLQVGAHLVNNKASGDPTLVYASIALMLGSPVQRGTEAIARRTNGNGNGDG